MGEGVVMIRRLLATFEVCAVVVWLCAATAPASGSTITSADIIPMPMGAVGSGNGTLDFVLMTESAGGSTNDPAGPLNFDNANTMLPTGGGTSTANETFMTSFGELRDFYILNFPNGSGGSTITEIALFVDVNETGGLQDLFLDELEIVSDYNQIYGGTRDNPHLNDILSATQNSTNTNYSGGTLLASLDASPKQLLQVSVGAGFADQVIYTGINPFDPAFSSSTRFLFHWESSVMNDGGETIFLSGTFAPQDVPEPSTLALLALGGLSILPRRRR